MHFFKSKENEVIYMQIINAGDFESVQSAIDFLSKNQVPESL